MVRGVARAAVLLGRALGLAALALLDWSDRLIYLGLLAVEGSLITRVFLKVLDANPRETVTQIAYSLSSPLVHPVDLALHQHILAVGPYVLEPDTVVALIGYAFAAWLLVVFLNLTKRLVRYLI